MQAWKMCSRIFVYLALYFCVSAAHATSAQVPIERFIESETYSHVQISPDGKRIAMVKQKDKFDALAIFNLPDLSVSYATNFVEANNNMGVARLKWIDNSKILLHVVTRINDEDEDPNNLNIYVNQWRIFNVETKEFLGHNRVTGKLLTTGPINSHRYDIVSSPYIDDGIIYFKSLFDKRTRIFTFDANTMDWHPQSKLMPAEYCSLIFNNKGQFSIAQCIDDSNEDKHGYYSQDTYRMEADGKWQKIYSSAATGVRYYIQHQSPDGTYKAEREDAISPSDFGKIDISNMAYTSIFKHPSAEIADYLVSPLTKDVIGVFTENGYPEVAFTSDTHSDVQLYKKLSKAFPGQVVDFLNSSKDGNLFMFSVRSDKSPGEYYLYDRKTETARHLLPRAGFKPSEMAEVIPYEFINKENLKIQAYLTLPPNSEGKKLPLIVNPHGGPMNTKDDWYFNSEAQLFASRGYAVLNVNFRGSDGYGDVFEDKAYGQWSTGIINDILDATNWVIDEGYVDSNRICIYGASFGGYAAMMAPAKAPGLFKCAFGHVGAYSAEVQWKKSDTRQTRSGRDYLRRALGESPEQRAAIMPLAMADKIKIPVFLTAGKLDKRTPPANTLLMAAALEKAGNKPENVIVFDGEEHSGWSDKNRIILYNHMLEFFNRHIGTKQP